MNRMEELLEETVRAFNGPYGIERQREVSVRNYAHDKNVSDSFVVAQVLAIVPFYNAILGKMPKELIRDTFVEFYNGLVTSCMAFSAPLDSGEIRNIQDVTFAHTRKALKEMGLKDSEIKKILG